MGCAGGGIAVAKLKGGGQRISRHYYDVYRLLASEIGRKSREDAEVAED
jgi:hypothetical protein